MPAIMQLESTLTDRYQTTVPESVRRALHLGKRDRIHYTIRPDGEVVLTRAAASDSDDPALVPFLDFLARDIAEQPERLRAVDAGLAQRINTVDVLHGRVSVGSGIGRECSRVTSRVTTRAAGRQGNCRL